MRELVGGLLSLVAPLRCVGCDEVHDRPAAFCDPCAALLQPGVGVGAVFEYGGPVADAIQRFKYDGRSEVGPTLASLMAEHARRWAGEVEAVVPVPLHWRRRRTRGYDQTALLAQAIGTALGVPSLLRGLRRVRNTPRQVDLPHGERQQNVVGAFRPWRLGGATRVLLVDDVRTTGATLRAAAKALEAGGVSQVETLVLAARVLGQPT